LIKVGIVSPSIATRAGLRALLSDAEGISIVAEAASLDEIGIGSRAMDVVVWAPASPVDPDGLAAAFDKMGEEAYPALLCVYGDAGFVENLAQLPLRGWGVLDPEATQPELIASVLALSEGLCLVNPYWLRQQLKKRIRVDAHDEVVEVLTTRETEILQLLALGLTNKQIAFQLKISTHTVKYHIATIYAKLGTTNRVETVNMGLKRGLIVL